MARRAQEIPSVAPDELDQIGGRYLIPIYTETDPETGRQLAGLGPNDFHKVTRGYACPECLLDFDGMYRLRCPSCGHMRDPFVDIKNEPDYWKPDPNDPYRRAA